MQEKLLFRYWNFRGIGQIPRLLLAYSGIAWQQKTYDMLGNKAEWFDKDKKQLNHPFSNLPSLTDQEFTLNESSAIIQYIARKSDKGNLMGKDLKDNARILQVIGVMQQALYKNCFLLCFNKNWETQQVQCLENAKAKLNAINSVIGCKNTILQYLTIADFYLYQYSHYTEKFFPQIYQKLEGFRRVRENIENLEQIKAYYSKNGSIKNKFLPPFAELDF